MSNAGDAMLVYRKKAMAITAYDLAERFIGTTEVPGPEHNCQIMAWLQMFLPWVEDDLTAHCGVFVGANLTYLGLPVPDKPGRARSYLTIGRPIPISEARRGFDLVIFRRKLSDPGPDVLDALGHVAFFDSWYGASFVNVLGANQDDTVKVAPYLSDNIIGVRRVYG